MPYQSNLREAWGQALLELARQNPAVVALEADLGKSTRSILMKAELPERYFEMGIAEQNMASTAAGLALAGQDAVHPLLRGVRIRSAPTTSFETPSASRTWTCASAAPAPVCRISATARPTRPSRTLPSCAHSPT